MKLRALLLDGRIFRASGERKARRQSQKPEFGLHDNAGFGLLSATAYPARVRAR